MLKLLDKDSIELRILEFLNNIKSDVNHVISVLDSIRLDIGTIIAFPIASPLGCPDFTKLCRPRPHAPAHGSSHVLTRKSGCAS